MKILLCIRDVEKLAPINNFLKIPMDIIDSEFGDVPENMNYFCILSYEKINISMDIEVLYANEIQINKENNEILWVKNRNIERLEEENYFTFYSLLEDIKNCMRILTENEIIYDSPIINEKITILENIFKQIFIYFKQPFSKMKYLPAGFSWGICISHDVDNLSLKEHNIDEVSAKSLISSYIELFYGHRTITSTFRYTSACVKCLLFGSNDPYDNINEWISLEKDIPSSFYFAMKNGRGIKYSHEQIKSAIRLLSENGFEIGIHGQNHTDPELMKTEFEELLSYSGKMPAGIRMHYLNFSSETWHILEDIGYLYDTTYGFSKETGYRAGTVIPYNVTTTTNKKIVEIPLQIMDTTLFNVLYMNLSTDEAVSLTEKAINQCKKYNGVLSALIHQRSISPHFMRYRNWYLWLRNLILNDETCWIVSNEKLAQWHNQWHDIVIDCTSTVNGLQIVINRALEKSSCVEVTIDENTINIEIPAGKREVLLPENNS